MYNKSGKYKIDKYITKKKINKYNNKSERKQNECFNFI